MNNILRYKLIKVKFLCIFTAISYVEILMVALVLSTLQLVNNQDVALDCSITRLYIFMKLFLYCISQTCKNTFNDAFIVDLLFLL